MDFPDARYNLVRNTLSYSTNASASVTFEDLKLEQRRVAYKLSHVTQNAESLPPEKLCGVFRASLIKYAVPTMTTCVHNNLSINISSIGTRMMAVNGRQSTAKYS